MAGEILVVFLHFRVADPDLFGQIRIIFSGSFRYFGYVKFQVNFSILSDKNNHHSNNRRNMIDVKKI